MTVKPQERTRLIFSAHERREEGDVEIHEFIARIPDDLRWFSGHFDGNPVLPAMVQLHEALLLVRATWADLHSLRRVKRAKFHTRIRPSEVLRLRLKRAAGTGRASFEFLREAETCSSGVLEFATREVSEGE